MASENTDSSWDHPWFIAYHDSRRKSAVTADAIEHANRCNYDMLTSPITTDHFHSRVLALLAAHDSASDGACPIIPSLSYLDSHLSPGEVAPQLLAYTSTWIDICSPDPLISGISEQVLKLEVAYAAFCGVENVIVSGPRLRRGVGQASLQALYARAIQEALTLASHVHFSISLPAVQSPTQDADIEMGDLSEHARQRCEPIHGAGSFVDTDDGSDSEWEGFDAFGTWDVWNSIRSMCNYSTRLSVVLSIPGSEILTRFAKSTITLVHCRWYSEPIRALSLQRSSFIEANKQNMPALSFPVQALISRLARLRFAPWFILKDVGTLPSIDDVTTDKEGNLRVRGFKDKIFRHLKSPTPAEAASTSSFPAEAPEWPFLHLDYLRYLQKRQPSRTVLETYGSGYQDYLQIPLQPLTNNLESMTYEVFEKDPVKYELYEEAIRKALRDWKEKKIAASGRDGRVVIAVAGAGRGPLVARALKASEEEDVAVELWAVEKNPNALVYLQRRNREEWSHVVSVEKSDMRSWKGPWHSQSLSNHQNSVIEGMSTQSADAEKVHHPVDILVSELLGSFADNELSPECLDGILHLLAPTGISIPQSYSAYMTPVAAPKLHADILSRTLWDSTAPETPSVVLLHAIDYLSSGEPKIPKTGALIQSAPSNSPKKPIVLEAWSFRHSPYSQKQALPVSNAHNARFASMVFDIGSRAACHGIAGYFESVLYPGTELSTHPNTMESKSSQMISWFPIFFPLKTPMYLSDDSRLTVALWRKTDDRKVWYEWLVESWMKDPRQRGRYVRLGSSGIHSSIKNGCLM